MSDALPVDELAPSGRLRATINLGNPVLAQKDPSTGELRGVSVELAHELGRRLGLEVELVAFDTAGKAFAALQSEACDVGFLAIDPVRAADPIAFQIRALAGMLGLGSLEKTRYEALVRSFVTGIYLTAAGVLLALLAEVTGLTALWHG